MQHNVIASNTSSSLSCLSMQYTQCGCKRLMQCKQCKDWKVANSCTYKQVLISCEQCKCWLSSQKAARVFDVISFIHSCFHSVNLVGKSLTSCTYKLLAYSKLSMLIQLTEHWRNSKTWMLKRVHCKPLQADVVGCNHNDFPRVQLLVTTMRYFLLFT